MSPNHYCSIRMMRRPSLNSFGSANSTRPRKAAIARVTSQWVEMPQSTRAAMRTKIATVVTNASRLPM
jgi:hypothetical protein